MVGKDRVVVVGLGLVEPAVERTAAVDSVDSPVGNWASSVTAGSPDGMVLLGMVVESGMGYYGSGVQTAGIPDNSPIVQFEGNLGMGRIADPCNLH